MGDDLSIIYGPVHVWPDGRRWIAASDGSMIPLGPDGEPDHDSRVVAGGGRVYSAPPGSRWEPPPDDAPVDRRRRYIVWECWQSVPPRIVASFSFHDAAERFRDWLASIGGHAMYVIVPRVVEEDGTHDRAESGGCG